MDPIHSISDILKHALVGHEKISIFEAHLTTEEAKKVEYKMAIQIIYWMLMPE